MDRTNGSWFKRAAIHENHPGHIQLPSFSTEFYRRKKPGPMPRYKLRMLLILLAVGPPLLAGAWLTREYIAAEQNYYDLWHDPARYPELEAELIKRGHAERGPDGTLRPIIKKTRAP